MVLTPQLPSKIPLLVSAAVGVAGIVAVAVARTLRGSRHYRRAAHISPHPIKLTEEAIRRLCDAIKRQTISWEHGKQEFRELIAFREFLEESFVTIHSSPLVTREIVSEYSLLYYVRGSDTTLNPFLMNAHMDVVPAPTEGWTHDPFLGEVVGGSIYGRGAIDDKGSLLAMFEAVETLMIGGFEPKRGFYMAIGHDEEIGGSEGASCITDLLESQDIQIEFVHDEGTVVLSGFIPGTKGSMALVGVSEKGFATLSLSLSATGGHSSLPPPPPGVITQLSAALQRLERGQSHVDFSDTLSQEFFVAMRPRVNGVVKFVISNLWLFGSLLAKALQAKVIGYAFRTSTAVTIFNSGTKDNVLPRQATACINHRIHPRDSVAAIIARDRALIADPDITVSVGMCNEPHPIADHGPTAFGWNCVKTAIEKSVGGDVFVTPGLFIAASDSRHYQRLTTNCYRFLPTRLTPATSTMYHGINERIAVENYEEMINFYYHMITTATGMDIDEMYT